MSGGAFNYNQFMLNDIVMDIQKVIEHNNNNELNDFDEPRYHHYEAKTIERFKEAITALEKAEKMIHRIDWLLSGDDGEEEFHKRWDEEILQ
jgi:hypothetical protein